MNTIRMFLVFVTLTALGFVTLLNAQPVPYPDVPTTADTKVEVKGEQNGSNGSSASSDAGTQKGLVSINTGGKAIMGVGSFDVKIEGKNVIRLSPSTQNYSESGTGIDCSQYPNHCNVMIYEFMKEKLPQTKLRSVGSLTLAAVGEASKSLHQDFRKKVKGGGLWVRLSSGEWIRIDGDIMLTKAVINQLWRKGK